MTSSSSITRVAIAWPAAGRSRGSCHTATPTVWSWRWRAKCCRWSETPVLAGVCASDPFRLIDRFLDQLKLIGFSGVQNFPTVGLIDGTFARTSRRRG